MGEISDYSIATIGSHTALQILKGAKDEGFRTVAVCTPQHEKVYRFFGVADEIILVDDYKNFPEIEPQLIKHNTIVIPHGSFISNMGSEKVEAMKPMYYGNKKIIEWESNRRMERVWLKKAGMRTPMIFEEPKDIDRSVIVKFYGAHGGKGYFLASSEQDFRKKIEKHMDKKYVIQEYIIGVPIYAHYFYDKINDKLEIMSFDVRYESNVDSLGRIPARDQIALGGVDPSYVVVGNQPIVVRESLLYKFIEMGEAVVKASKNICPPGIWGPFCLEGVITPALDFFIFEISARIVAGTNLYIRGSPYTDVKYDVPMSTGRRIALDIRNAIQKDKIKEIVMD